jgi:Ca2+-transporting ATPase
MITGDHPATAAAIARHIGIISDADCSVLKGREVDILGEDGLKTVASFPRVFARVSPQNKLAIVKALQARKHITAMTGDGVNDAPAIRRADIGIAMGLTGTDIAKQAADIVLADDNFSTIIGAVEEGRRVYDNITKFVVYILACNSAEIWIVLMALILKLPVPLASIHILWANIIADIPPSMSIGCEPAEVDLLMRPPRQANDRLLSGWNVVYIVLLGFFISFLSLFRYIYGCMFQNGIDLGLLRAEVFMCLTILQLVLALFSRSLTQSAFSMSPLGNAWMILALSVSTLTLLLGCYIPGLNSLLEMAPIDHFGWLRIGACCLALLIFTEILKLLRRTRGK